MSGRLVRGFIRLDAAPDEGLVARLAAVGITPGQITTLALTHQHADHTAAVPAFPGADVWTSRAEDAAGAQIGALPWRWRTAGTRIRHVDVEGRPSESGLGVAVPLLPDGSVEAIHTPGHTPGSLTVRLRADQGEVLFTGDTSFTAATLDPSAPTAGIHTDLSAVRALQTRLRDWLARRPNAQVLPSHDWDVGARLAGARLSSP